MGVTANISRCSRLHVGPSFPRCERIGKVIERCAGRNRAVVCTLGCELRLHHSLPVVDVVSLIGERAE